MLQTFFSTPFNFVASHPKCQWKSEQCGVSILVDYRSSHDIFDIPTIAHGYCSFNLTHLQLKSAFSIWIFPFSFLRRNFNGNWCLLFQSHHLLLSLSHMCCANIVATAMYSATQAKYMAEKYQMNRTHMHKMKTWTNLLENLFAFVENCRYLHSHRTQRQCEQSRWFIYDWCYK